MATVYATRQCRMATSFMPPGNVGWQRVLCHESALDGNEFFATRHCWMATSFMAQASAGWERVLCHQELLEGNEFYGTSQCWIATGLSSCTDTGRRTFIILFRFLQHILLFWYPVVHVKLNWQCLRAYCTKWLWKTCFQFSFQTRIGLYSCERNIYLDGMKRASG